MDSFMSRYNTFKDTEWGEGFAFSVFANAGFFSCRALFTVTCFACGGSLTGWSDRVEIWQAHAYWFPHCSHILRKRGQHYVNATLRGSSEGWDEDGSVLPVSLTIRLKLLAWSPTYRLYRQLGAGEHALNRSLRMFVVRHARYFSSTQEILSVMETALHVQTMNRNLARPEGEVSHLPQELECTICLTERRAMAFLPCGHVVTCVRCSTLVQQECIMCRAPVERVARVYLS